MSVYKLPNPYRGLSKPERLARYYRLHGNSADDPLGYDKGHPARQCNSCEKWYYPPGPNTELCLTCKSAAQAAAQANEPDPVLFDYQTQEISTEASQASTMDELKRCLRKIDEFFKMNQQSMERVFELLDQARAQYAERPNRYWKGQLEYRESIADTFNRCGYSLLDDWEMLNQKLAELERREAELDQARALGGARIVSLHQLAL